MEDRQFYAFTLVQIVVVCGLLWFIFIMPGSWDWQRCLGTALILAGGWDRGGALPTGQVFRHQGRGHQLVTR